MEYRQLGRNGPMVSVIGLGCFAFGGDKKSGNHLGKDMESLHEGIWGEQSESDTFNVVKAALDVGINLFDTAEMYGSGYSEEVLGKALKASGYERSQYMIATKVCESYLSKELLRQHLQASLDRLGVDYIDVYQIHWHSRAAVKTATYPQRPLEKEVPLEETLEELAKLRQEGKIKHVGVCNFGPQDIQDAVRIGVVPIVSNQLPYSLLWRAIEGGGNDDSSSSVTKVCQEHGIGIMVWGGLMQGMLCGKYPTADDVPPGRARNRLFSHQRPQQRHGEPGFETETFQTIQAIQTIAATTDATAAAATKPEQAAETETTTTTTKNDNNATTTAMTQLSLAWILRQKNISNIGTLLMGARNSTMLTDNVLPAIRYPLETKTIEELNTVTEDLKQKLVSSNNLDPYESKENTRIL